MTLLKDPLKKETPSLKEIASTFFQKKELKSSKMYILILCLVVICAAQAIYLYRIEKKISSIEQRLELIPIQYIFPENEILIPLSDPMPIVKNQRHA